MDKSLFCLVDACIGIRDMVSASSSLRPVAAVEGEQTRDRKESRQGRRTEDW